jgi:hypothetical protein
MDISPRHEPVGMSGSNDTDTSFESLSGVISAGLTRMTKLLDRVARLVEGCKGFPKA